MLLQPFQVPDGASKASKLHVNIHSHVPPLLWVSPTPGTIYFKIIPTSTQTPQRPIVSFVEALRLYGKSCLSYDFLGKNFPN